MPATVSTPALPERTAAPRLQTLLERYVALQLAGERAAARPLLLRDGLNAGLSVVEFYRSVLEPAQYRVGDLWQANKINIAREHLATAVTEAVMGRPCRVRAAPIRHGDARAGGVRGGRNARHRRTPCSPICSSSTGSRCGSWAPTDSLLAIVREESGTAASSSSSNMRRCSSRSKRGIPRAAIETSLLVSAISGPSTAQPRRLDRSHPWPSPGKSRHLPGQEPEVPQLRFHLEQPMAQRRRPASHLRTGRLYRKRRSAFDDLPPSARTGPPFSAPVPGCRAVEQSSIAQRERLPRQPQDRDRHWSARSRRRRITGHATHCSMKR